MRLYVMCACADVCVLNEVHCHINYCVCVCVCVRERERENVCIRTCVLASFFKNYYCF